MYGTKRKGLQHRQENLEKWENVFQSGIFEHTWKSQGILHKILEI